MSSSPGPGKAIARLLTFRLGRDEVLSLGRRHLWAALLSTSVVGMGRWWDDPGAHLLQHLGIGSVVYVCVLSAILWLVVLPLRPLDWSYERVLTFVAMTSPPALLYAIPVERLFELRTAGQLNLWFLAAVATWRVALLLWFLVLVPRIGVFTAVIVGLLPLTAIVTSLAALNLHRVVFNLMGSIADNERSAHDDAYGVLVLLTMLSWVALPVLMTGYGVAVYVARRRKG